MVSASHFQSEFKVRSDRLIEKIDEICIYIDTYRKLIWLLTPQNRTIISVIALQAKFQHKMDSLRFVIQHRHLRAESFTILWLDSESLCPPPALQNTASVLWWRHTANKIYFMNLNLRVREQIYSVSSTKTIHIEKACFQNTKCADLRIN